MQVLKRIIIERRTKSSGVIEAVIKKTPAWTATDDAITGADRSKEERKVEEKGGILQAT